MDGWMFVSVWCTHTQTHTDSDWAKSKSSFQGLTTQELLCCHLVASERSCSNWRRIDDCWVADLLLCFAVPAGDGQLHAADWRARGRRQAADHGAGAPQDGASAAGSFQPSAISCQGSSKKESAATVVVAFFFLFFKRVCVCTQLVLLFWFLFWYFLYMYLTSRNSIQNGQIAACGWRLERPRLFFWNKNPEKKALKKTLDFTFGGDERKNSQDLREASRQLAVPFVTSQRAGLENCMSFFSASGVKDILYIIVYCY